MQRTNFYRHLSQSPIICNQCKKCSPYYFHLLTQNKKSFCYECVKANDDLLSNVAISYKQNSEQLFNQVPLPDTDFALECVKSLDQMKTDAMKIVNDLKKNIQQFELDILEFYTQAKIICQGYIDKMKSLSEKTFDEVLRCSSTFIKQQKYTRNIKSKYKVSCIIRQTLQQIKIKIPSIKQLTTHYQNQVKRHSICQVPIHSAICIRSRLYFGTADGRIIYEDNDKWLEIKAHQSLIRSLAYDGQYTMFSGSDDFKIKAWNLQKKHEIKFIAEFGTIPDLKSYHRDILVFNKGRTMATTRGQFDGFKIRLWQLGSYTNIKQFSGHQNYIRGMTINRKQQLITVSDDRTLKVWSTATRRCDRIFYHSKKIHNVHANKQRDLICIYDQENRAMILDDSKLHIVQCWSIGKKVFSSEGKNKIYFGISSQIVVYDWNGLKLHTHPLDVNFLPGTMLQVHQKLIVCDGKGKCLQIPFVDQK